MNNHKNTTFWLICQRCWFRLTIVAVMLIISTYLAAIIAEQALKSSNSKIRDIIRFNSESRAGNQKASMFDGCFHIFLDVGANWGITTRKIFEPQLYPGSRSIGYFDKYFGVDRLEKLSADPKYICAAGFEPNPRHAMKLKEIETQYQKCGWNVKMSTETAIYDEKGTMTFSQGSMPDQNTTDVFGTIFGKNWKQVKKGGQTATVATIRLSDFFHKHILNRVPNKRESELKEEPKIIGKVDCESCEVEMLFDLMKNGLLTKFNFVTIEYHNGKLTDKVNKIYSALPPCFLCPPPPIEICVLQFSTLRCKK